MKQRGRKSVLAMSAIRGITRPAPPATLKNPAEAAIWALTVNAVPAQWFGGEHLHLLANYCRVAAATDEIAAQLDKVDPRSEDYGRLRAMLREEIKMVVLLARNMRISHHAAHRAESKTIEHNAGARPWSSASDD